jgi:hypothetical protein
MKKVLKQLLVLFFPVLGTIFSSQAQPCLKWNHDIGGNNDGGESFGNVISVADGFLACGTANSNDPKFNVPTGHGNDAFIAKYNSSGNLVWKHSYGGSGEDGFKMIISAPDGGFICIGHTSSNDGDVSGNHGAGDAWIVKTDAAGNLQWQKCYGGSKDDYALVIINDPSGYTFSGAESSRDGNFANNFGDYDAWVVKISFTGTVLWQSTYGGSKFDAAVGLTRNDDGTYIFASPTTSNNQEVGNTHGGSYDTWVVKITGSGSIIWKKVYGGSGFDYCNAMTRTTDGNLVLTHGSNSTDGDVNGPGIVFSWLMKLNPQNGSIIWSKTFSVSELDCASFGIFPASDGGVVSLGVQGPIGDSSRVDALILAIDVNGNKKWHRFLAGSKYDAANAGTEINSGDLLVLGSSSSVDGDFAGGSGNQDIWISKFHNCADNSSSKTSAINNPINEPVLYKLTNYPNPFSYSTTITYSILQTGKVSLKIFDMSGRLIITIANEQMQAGVHEIKWNANNSSGRTVSSGVYLLRIEAGDFKETRKIFVAK